MNIYTLPLHIGQRPGVRLLCTGHSLEAWAELSTPILQARRTRLQAKVGHAVTLVQLQIKEPWPCLQCNPFFRRKVVPNTVLVELNLRNVAGCVTAQSKVKWSSGDVVLKLAVVTVILPI